MDLKQKKWASELKEDNNAFILDVRTEQEFEEGYIPNAFNLDIYNAHEFMEQVKKFDNTKNYYVYCRSGKRSAQACQILKQNGIDNTFNLEGGFMEWEGEIEE